jgi:hypothetical protein
MKKTVTLFIILLSGFNSYAQNYNRIDTIPVYNYGRQLIFPWVGGINTPQFSTANLVSQGVSLLVIFDRCGNHFYTFLNEEIPDSVSYIYAPQYEKNFPACQNWALLRDYNCDGIPDIFSSSPFIPGSVDVYRGFYNENNELDFTLASPELTFPYTNINGGFQSNVYVPNSDLPAIDDIDGDGTMDILAYGTFGGYINYYRNTSEDSDWGCDSLRYVWQSGCWGKVYDNYWLTMVLNTCQGFLGAPRSPGNGEADAAQHHQGNTLCTFDEDSSGHKSAIWGQVTFPYSVFIHNAGFPDTFYIDWQDTTFPSYGVHDSIRSWPASFSLDVNNDGYKDLLFAPNWEFGAQDFHNVRYYKQMPSLYNYTGTKYKQYYQYQNDSLFCKDMIDVGSGSAPTFFHYFNGDDTVYDMVIGSIGSYNISETLNGRLTLYRNTGSHDHPVFQLVSNDFDSISNYELSTVVPTFGDLRGTGTEDMILGNSAGTLYYFKNVASPGHPAQYVLPNAVGAGQNYDGIAVATGYSAPQLVDVDSDGLLDLIIGCEAGTLSYYHNDGTVDSPKFDLVSSNWGGVNVTYISYTYNYSDSTFDTVINNVHTVDTVVVIDTIPYAYPAYSHPYLYRDSTGKSILLVGSNYMGKVYRYDSIDNNLNGKFALTDSSFANIETGFVTQCAVSGASILGHANPEIAIGNYRGGVTLYTTGGIPTGIQQVQKLWMNCVLYPNPSDNDITINLPGVANTGIVNIEIEDELGRTVLSNTYENQQTKITMQVSQLPVGLYFCRITIGNDFVVRKFVVTHRD